MRVSIEVTIDGNYAEAVKGDRMYVENGYLMIEDSKGAIVAIFAKFDSAIAKPAEQE